MLRLSWGCSLFAPLFLGRCFGHRRNGNSIAGSGTRKHFYLRLQAWFASRSNAGGVLKLQANQRRASPARRSSFLYSAMLKQRFINKCSGSLPRAGLHGRKALLQADGGGTAVVDQPRRHHWGRPAPSVGVSTRRDFGQVLRVLPGAPIAAHHRIDATPQVAICPLQPQRLPTDPCKLISPLMRSKQALRVSSFLRYSPRGFLGAS